MARVTEEETVKKGLYLYPERRGGTKKESMAAVALRGEGRQEIDRVRCEKNVQDCANNSPLVKLMLSALKSAGCEVDLKRHISCEPCGIEVTGGYDAEMNQVVVCQNTARKSGMIQGILAHELLHMFDACRAKLDLRNVEHLACTEIRAANLMHCSFMSAMLQGLTSPFDFKKTHEICVKHKAVQSILAVTDVSKETAEKVVDKVFNVCYNDLEPVGRRLRRSSVDMEKAYAERYHYGYLD